MKGLVNEFNEESLLEIIDDDAFPGNKHREEILKGEDAIWNISGFSLFSEFFRLNFIRSLAISSSQLLDLRSWNGLENSHDSVFRPVEDAWHEDL